MNRAVVDQIANAVLYEGYILYPYRPAVKNRQRCTFGGLYPAAYCEARQNGDSSCNQTECLVRGSATTALDVTVRFLHLTARQVRQFDPPSDASSAGAEASARPVETLRVGDKVYHSWEEAEERSVDLGDMTIRRLLVERHRASFSFPGGRRFEPVAGPDGDVRGVLVREQQTLSGAIELSAWEVETGLYRIRLRVLNCTPWSEPEARARVNRGLTLARASGSQTRDFAVLSALVSAHAILGVHDGQFVSLTDPPDKWRAMAAGCHNVGMWPVLVGDEGAHDIVLSSPIILEDYPRVAPESPCDFFDGGEIDEMLTLRIMTLTDDEKRSMAAVDVRAGALLARTEALAREQLLGLHGKLRPVEDAARG
jgi:hydrogenase maturation protease